jgi:choline kinase
MKAVILAAGVGSRLGGTLPKSLIQIGEDTTILSNQVTILKKLGVREIIVVVGFKKEVIMEYYPELVYVYNPRFHITNTAYSLKLALERVTPDDVLWTNGDVVFEEAIAQKMVEVDGNAVAVVRKPCGEEEVKYTVTPDGNIGAISKAVENPEGEAIGINRISRADFDAFLVLLRDCSDDDYFEKAIEGGVTGGMEFSPVDVTDHKCIEVDFEDDLREVKSLGKLWHI